MTDYGAITFEAEFGGECSECDQPIKPGQKITRTPFALGPGYHHVMCPVAVPREVCDRCFMEKAANGTCLCND